MTIRKDKGYYVRNYSKHPHIRTYDFEAQADKVLNYRQLLGDNSA